MFKTESMKGRKPGKGKINNSGKSKMTTHNKICVFIVGKTIVQII